MSMCQYNEVPDNMASTMIQEQTFLYNITALFSKCNSIFVATMHLVSNSTSLV